MSESFDDPNLVSRAGLIPVMALAERAGLTGLVREHVRIAVETGVLPEVKVGCLVAAMPPANDKITITSANQPKRSPAFTRWIEAK